MLDSHDNKLGHYTYLPSANVVVPECVCSCMMNWRGGYCDDRVLSTLVFLPIGPLVLSGRYLEVEPSSCLKSR